MMKRSLLATMAMASVLGSYQPPSPRAQPYGPAGSGTKTAKTHRGRAKSKAAAKSRRDQRKNRK